MQIRRSAKAIVTAIGVGVVATPLASAPAAAAPPKPTLQLSPCRLPGIEREVRCASYEVYENRSTRAGRKIALKVIVVPAVKASGHAPVLEFFGGPGQTASELAQYYAGSWENLQNDVIFIDQRGTGNGNRLDCDNLPGSSDNPQGYLEPVFQASLFQACRERLERKFDLTQYTTPNAVDDFDDVRSALGYDKLNLEGGSYGSRAILTYLRRHPQHVQSVWIVSSDTFGFKNPLYHARSAEEALDGILLDCAADARCRAAYPNPRADLQAVLRRLQSKPATVTFRLDGQQVRIVLDRDSFAEGLRAAMYDLDNQMMLPFMLKRAREGDLSAFARAAYVNKRALRDGLRYGLLQTIVCNEDADRIAPYEVERATVDTFLGDARVRQQLEACAVWPKAKLPADYAAPFESQIPAIIVSGSHDPATPVRWGERMAVYLPNSIQLVVPGGHSPSNDCANALGQQLFADVPIGKIDTQCTRTLRRPPFFVPKRERRVSRSASRQQSA